MSKSRATDPGQYDLPELDWRIGGAEDRPSRKWFREFLDDSIPLGSLQGKRIIDIGSGVGQLFNWLKAHGAVEVVGIDPAIRNVKTSTELYPWATSIQGTLHEFVSSNSKKFDMAFAVMVFEHIQDLRGAFGDVRSLLAENGQFCLIISDKDFNITENRELRGKNFVNVEIVKDFGDGSVEAKTIRNEGEGYQTVLHDIFRPLEHVRDAAKENGFTLMLEQPIMGPYTLPPGERKVAINHLFVFKK